MPTTTVTKELFPKATTTLAQVQDERDLRLASDAVRSTIDDQSDPANFILTTERNIVGLDADPASPPARAAAASPSAPEPEFRQRPGAIGCRRSVRRPAPSGAAALNGILKGFHGTGASPATAGPIISLSVSMGRAPWQKSI